MASTSCSPRAARGAWQRLIGERTPVHTTNYVLVETAALLQGRIGMDGLRTLAADILPILNVLWVEEGMHRSAHHALLVSSRDCIDPTGCRSWELTADGFGDMDCTIDFMCILQEQIEWPR